MVVLQPAHQPAPPRPPDGPPPGAPPLARAWTRRHEPVPGRWAAGVGGAWLAMFVIEPFLVPAPAEPGPPPWWDVAFGLAWLVLFGVVAFGCARRRRLGLHASALGVALTVPLVVACPVSGHHGWAAWWALDLGLWLAVGAVTLEALRRTPGGHQTVAPPSIVCSTPEM